MRQPKVGDKVTIHKWHYQDIKLPQKGEITSVDGNHGTPYEIRIEIDHNGDTDASWWFREGEFTIDEEQLVLKDREGRDLKKFEVGKWYTNPKYDFVGKFRAKYFKVGSVILQKRNDVRPQEYYYNKLVFDAVASENWEEIEDIRLTQSNSYFDQQMELVENPYNTDIEQAIKQVVKEEYPNNTPFKIGDRVEILLRGSIFRKELKHNRISEIGETGVITNIHREDVEIKMDKDGQYSTRFHNKVKILESAPKVEPVQTESQYYDGPSLVGRYVRAKEDTSHGVKAGEYLLIESEDIYYWDIEKYLSCTKLIKEHDYLTNVFDLMPEGFVPPSKSSKTDFEQEETKPPIKENPSPIRTINTIQTKLKNKNKKVRL